MNEIIKNILTIKNSKSYIEYNEYHKGNVFSVTKTSRKEHTHSNFIAWLLDSNNVGTYVACKFLNMLSVSKDKIENKNARFNYVWFDEKDILESTCETEVSFKEGTKQRFVDIVVKVKTKDRIIPIIIENKVDSTEHDKQTKAYFDWGEKTFADKTMYREALYVFLSPYQKKIVAETKEYLNVTYQEMVDYVIEPTMWTTNVEKHKYIINMYLQCLSYQVENENGDYVMALSSEERRILDEFIKENKNLLCAVINELDDDEVSPSAKSAITSSVRDYSTYIFDGVEYKKARLVLAIVKKWVKENNPKTFNELELAFPPSLQGSKGVVKEYDKISDNDKGLNDKQKRYFVDAEEIICLDDGNVIAVSSQWGNGNIDNVINKAINDFEYDIRRM